MSFRLLYYLGLLLTPFSAAAQNMVNNGNFEAFSKCPTSENQTSNCIGWRAYHSGSSDYLNACSGSHVGIPVNDYGIRWPASGSAYMGLYLGQKNDSTDYKEYIAGSVEALTVNTPYEISMSVSLADISVYGSPGLGAWFYETDPGFTGTARLPVTPQVSFSDTVIVKAGWQRLSSIFVPDAPFTHLVIGGFVKSTDLDTVGTGSGSYDWTYYFIDSVVIKRVSRIEPEYHLRDYCAGDTVAIPFSIYSKGYFLAGNTFALQLSDSSGSFLNYSDVSLINDTSADTFKFVVSALIAPGHKYRFRVVASSNPDTSAVSPTFAIGNLKPARPSATSNAPVCTGKTLYLYVTDTTDGVNYEWQGPRGFFDTSHNPQIALATVQDSGTYIVTAKLFGCSASDTLNVHIAHVIGDVLVYDDSVCDNDTLKLTCQITGKPAYCAWRGPNGWNTTVPDTSIYPAGGMGGVYVFTAYFIGCSVADTTVISIKPAPAKPGAGDDTTICAGRVLILNGTDISNKGLHYWITPDGDSISGLRLQRVNTLPKFTGNYIFVSADSGCYGRDTSFVTVKPSPEVPLISDNSPVTVGTLLVLNIDNPETNVTYAWTGPGGFSTSGSAVYVDNVTPRNSGMYLVTASKDNCSITNDIIINVTANVDTSAVTIFPNANDGDFTIMALVGKDQLIPIYIIASNGQTVYATQHATQNKLLNISIRQKDFLASGEYTIKLLIDGFERSCKMVINR